MTLQEQIEQLIKKNSGANLDEAFERYFNEDNTRANQIKNEINEQFDQIKEAMGYGDVSFDMIECNVEEIDSLKRELSSIERRKTAVKQFISFVKNNKE